MKYKIFLALGFIIVNLIFNYNIFWHELVFDRSSVGAVWGEVEVFEWLTEKFYRTLIRGGNPFGLVSGMLYPFKLHLGLTDAANGLFFVFLRPFFSTHQSLALVITLSQLVANIGMYLLLRRLKFDRPIAFIIGLAYGFMTFLLPRGGHLNYWCVFVFPWFYYCILALYQTKTFLTKTFFCISAALFFVLTLWLNFYYFVMLLVSIGSFFCYFLLFRRKAAFEFFSRCWKWGILFIFFAMVLLIPWLKAVYDVVTFDEIPKTEGWGGAIEFSSDLFGFFIPSIYNYMIYKYFGSVLDYLVSHYIRFAAGIFENFTYPGLIIIFSYFGYCFLLRKKTFQTVHKKIKPYLFTSLVFLVLTLGPFLHVFGHWGITVDEGIRVVVPLPYVIFHYIPFLQNIRVPGRLAVGFIFFAYIVAAYVIGYFIKNKSTKIKVFVFIVLFLIFFVDQRYINSHLPSPQLYPYQLFRTIKKDPEKRVSVLEIPFSVRDGFTYFGDGAATSMIVGEAIHEKNVLGGYTGRIADYKKNYYRLNPFLGFLGRLIDQDIKNNPVIDKDDLVNWRSLNLSASRDVIEFLDLKYVILNEKKPYVATVSALLSDLGFKKKLEDAYFSLWLRDLLQKEFLKIAMNGRNDLIFLGAGWHKEEGNFRWSQKKSFVMLKINKKRKLDLHFQAAAFSQRQPMTIYVNKKKVVRIKLTAEMKDYSIKVPGTFNEGINLVHFISGQGYKPKQVLTGSTDERELAARFTKIYLTEASQ